MKEYKGKLQQVRLNSGVMLTLAPLGKNPWKDIGTYPKVNTGGGGWGDLLGVLSPRPYISGLFFGTMTDKGSLTSQATG